MWMKTWLCQLYIVVFEKEVKLAGVFWFPLTLRATSENKYSREKTALFHYFFLQLRTPDELKHEFFPATSW